jgi:hypothetical protein
MGDLDLVGQCMWCAKTEHGSLSVAYAIWCGAGIVLVATTGAVVYRVHPVFARADSGGLAYAFWFIMMTRRSPNHRILAPKIRTYF